MTICGCPTPPCLCDADAESAPEVAELGPRVLGYWQCNNADCTGKVYGTPAPLSCPECGHALSYRLSKPLPGGTQ